MALIKQMFTLLMIFIFVCAMFIAGGIMFPDGEVGAFFQEMAEGLQNLVSAAGDGASGAV